METEDVKLQDIQAGNQAARKKLEGFRSGLQRMMNKKSKKLSQHQPPSHDTKNPINTKQQNYFSTNSANSASSNLNSIPQVHGGQFGFNSTLFRQIGDDTVMFSNPSALHKQQQHSSKQGYNSVPHNYQQYFSSSSKPSTYYNEPRLQPIAPTQTFSKASKLFSQVEDIINKSRKTVKLPVKPIQKYFDRIEQQSLSESKVEEQELGWNKSKVELGWNKSEVKLGWDKSEVGFEEDKLGMRKERNIPSVKVGKGYQIKSEQKNKSLSAKDELKSASSFLKTFNSNNKGSKQELLMKAPPLPPSFPREQITSHSKQQQPKPSSKKIINQQSLPLPKPLLILPSKPTLTQNSIQIHKQKLKQALNQRKKIMKEDFLLDDSIQLELSDEQDRSEEKIVMEQFKAKNEEQLNRLKAEKEQLMKELKMIEEELDRFDNEK